MQLLYTVVFFRYSAPAETEAGSAENEDCSTLGAGEGRKLLGPKKVNLAHSLFYVTQIHNGAIRGRVCKCHFHRGSRPGTEGKYVVIVRLSVASALVFSIHVDICFLSPAVQTKLSQSRLDISAPARQGE